MHYRLRSTFLALMLLGTTTFVAPAVAADKAEVEALVRKVLEDNPEIVVNALKQAQQKEYEKQLLQAAKVVGESQHELLNNPHDPVAGNPNGSVSVVEFFDYNCGYCRHMFVTLSELIAEDKDVKIIFKEYPILSPMSELAARAAIAVNRIDKTKYFEFHKALMQSGGVSMETINAAATKLGISAEALKTEMDKPEVAEIIKQNQALAGKIGVRGTPALVINKELIPGALEGEELKAKIKFARDQKVKP